MPKKIKKRKFFVGEKIEFYTKGGFGTQKGEIIGFMVYTNEAGVSVKSVMHYDVLGER